MTIDIEKRFSLINGKLNSSMVVKAFKTAKTLHGGQVRKDGTPYINHPVEVAIILAEQGFDEDVISAALLHDVVEDCGYTLESIRENFNDEVASLVDAVSAIDNGQYEYDDEEIFEDQDFIKTSAEERTFKKLISLGKKDPLAFCIKFADRLHNLRTISIFERNKQLEKVRETEKWILPIAKNLGSEYFYTEISNECFKIINDSKNCGFFNHYDYYHKSNKNNFDNLLIKIKEAFSSSMFNVIIGFDKFENLVYDDICKLTKVDDIRKISQGQILRVSNYNIYFLHKDTSNKKAIIEFVNTVQKKLNDVVKIIDADISGFTNRIYFEIEDNHKNKYSANIMSKKDYTSTMLGTLNGRLYSYIDDENTHFIPTEYIRVMTRSGEVKYMPKDSTALDFAFKLHKDIGFGFKYVIINDSKNRLPAYTKLNEGDKIEIVVERDTDNSIKCNAKLKWLAYVNNELSKKILIKHFEKFIG